MEADETCDQARTQGGDSGDASPHQTWSGADMTPLQIGIKNQIFLWKPEVGILIPINWFDSCNDSVLPVWNSHCTRVSFTVTVSCSDELAVHSCPLLCLQRWVAKVASGLFYCWSLLRNNKMATNLQKFTLYYGSRRFVPWDCCTYTYWQIMQRDSDTLIKDHGNAYLERNALRWKSADSNVVILIDLAIAANEAFFSDCYRNTGHFCSVERIKRFVNVHLSCIVSNVPSKGDKYRGLPELLRSEISFSRTCNIPKQWKSTETRSYWMKCVFCSYVDKIAYLLYN